MKKRTKYMSVIFSVICFLIMTIGMKVDSYAVGNEVDIKVDSNQYYVSSVFNEGEFKYTNSDFSISYEYDVRFVECTSSNTYRLIVDGQQIGDPVSPEGNSDVLYRLPAGDYHIDTGTADGVHFAKITTRVLPPLDSEPSEENKYYLTPLEDELQAVIETLKQNPSIEPITVAWDKGDSLPLDVLKTLMNNPSISLKFEFEYEGVKHSVLIPAGKSFVDESIPWYGPAWLLEKYGEYNPEKKASYTVKSGDTLGDIARANGMTIEELIKKNPQITNENLIYPGDEINL